MGFFGVTARSAGWGLVLTRLSPGAATLLELDPSVPCERLGTVGDVAARVREVEPEAELSDPSHGWIRFSTWSIEPAIGQQDPVEWIRLFVRSSGDDVVGRIVRLADALGCVVFDDGELESVWDAEDVGLWHAYQRACEEEDASHAG
ncbi:hypothetical protein [Actinospica sp.]|uniref:hypothetical protein n=1 Tax=Actinospica sp. TaxID=1872142 RepID=UPI002CED3F94|nr:hypothetical protein [Actinospica sp.]HWG23370.1 hypothetical protein [Actinospica sp.]